MSGTHRDRGAPPLLTVSCLLLALLLCSPTAVWAGPPFLTDDPEPTERGHWELYSPLVEGEGLGADYEGSTGVEINYGPARDVQLTVGLPVAFAHDRSGMQWGSGDAAVSAKFRFYHDEQRKLSLAVFPGMTLSTATAGLGAGRVTGLLPVWFQKDSGEWSVFGGGGYAINPGNGNKDFWTGGIALSRQFSEQLLIGVEADRSGAATLDERASTNLGIGAIYQLSTPLRLLGSGGPVFNDAGGPAGFHFFVALGADR